jgi:redox-sensing transcriptional repressor
MPNLNVSEKTVGRLSIYRRILADLLAEGVSSLHSHQLASRAGVTAAQVRRDLMVTGYDGSPKHGYILEQLNHSLESFFDAPSGQNFALIGVGNLGRALLAFFSGRRPKLRISAAFDTNPRKYDRVIHGCRCYSTNELPSVAKQESISLAILAVPAAVAQNAAECAARAGISGFLNFAPHPLRMPSGIYVENVDLTMALEKVAFFSRRNQ